MARYIVKQKQGYYAALEIPKPLHNHFGKRRFKETLKTRDISEAQRRALPIIAKWKCEIEAARNENQNSLERDHKFWRESLGIAETNSGYTDEQGEDIYPSEYDIILDHLQGQAEKLDKQEDGSGTDFYQQSTGQKAVTSDYIEEWKKALTNTEKTKDMKVSSVRRFAEKFTTIDMVTKKEVRRWVDRLQQEDGLSLKTVKSILSACRDYWKYLTAIEVVSEDYTPLNNLGLASKVTKDKANERKSFTEEEVLTLLGKAKEKGDTSLADLITLGMWTGARIEELCSLKVNKVKDKSFEIEDAKTASGWREVPIHSKLKPNIQRLVKDSKDGYVLSGLSENKYGDRSNAIGKRFGRLKTELGFDRRHVFHSLRKTVISKFKHAGVNEDKAADIVGHDIPTMTYGLYADGSLLQEMIDAMEMITYRGWN
ncbi:tyrosine-type recombinase/integrase [Terasakiella sp. SH-1]|uniref:tyrosine-type recombinase/integrase n=1 Tax=Terasakiella sp. SH-1 TaxID=2560057 RepID=UPI001073353E|nr:tyrosine-type recombinase/integrase [Terasakiella sp. SH-1]